MAPRFSSADDSLTVTKNMDGSQNFVDMGDGNNVLNVGGYISGNTQVDFGNGNDKVHISGYLGARLILVLVTMKLSLMVNYKALHVSMQVMVMITLVLVQR